jgi:formamidopyrimidine-DNA glycosylase
VEPHCRGRAVSRVVVREKRLRWPVPDRLDSLLTGQTIESVGRRAKYLLFRMQAGSLMVHLGMSGSLRMVDRETPAMTHDHIDIELAGGAALRYHDPRRFGSVHWIPAGASHPLLRDLGPEPLSPEFDGALLYRRARGRNGPIKNFIMDAKVVVGVGNIYANEALFLAGIRPDRAAGRVSLARYGRLAEKIEQVLTNAIGQGGTTLRDFVGGDGRPGYFAQQLHVYGRAGEPCKRCQRPLRELRLGQRSSVYCVTCQR